MNGSQRQSRRAASAGGAAPARTLMVQGTASSAGKSLLTTALCAAAARAGVKVAPFKAQNMSNNARVVDGGEIGSAQALQAWAAGVTPDVRMNPVLVKPEGDTQSQVVRRGRVDAHLSGLRWEDRSALLWDDIRTSLAELRAEYEMVIIEGAGSPAEFNLWPYDLANMRVAAEADAPVLIVSDIDRGGALAHCYGTWALLPPDQQARVHGFVMNRFRGDVALLRPGLDGLTRRTGVPVVGVMPWLDHGLPDEDAAGDWDDRTSPHRAVAALPDGAGRRRSADLAPVVIVTYPTISNLDEFAQLSRAAPVKWARRPRDLAHARLIVLPGAKQVAASLDWLRATGLADAIAAAAQQGTAVLGVCGGLQMLGERIDDPHGVDGAREGLGLLPIQTTFAADKLTAAWSGSFGECPAPWRPWSHLRVTGYEIRHGATKPRVTPRSGEDGAARAEERGSDTLAAVLPDGRGYALRNVLGVSVHGLFEDAELTRALLGVDDLPALDAVFAKLADAVARYLDPTVTDLLTGDHAR